ncbi:ABC transporter ATP-binding protein [Pseudorhodoferax sp. Leaf265]|jgi:branched-chain amino acid transport system ATP-binding protein|uniref:ABC transporter ATP-binding protein n=1 Tax=Pseudorhodoferax sp. Leaf265 TaxID=1736315 RepID=UPI0006F2CF9F|nr:ABC transporter ATP-binding protein [Pseudorhodoferax sp. Leaf265]KQP05142.1 ABC transporter ATP-binding protein [Pseudorhodoferax sp. Leaf265]PZP96608.1 MAG: ABC transporter ATP-binding protein [Variovorax paradoxus]PZQ07827.1 MAG: ABC transporter ATP-binding protein [Variovorax paradoxus]
MTKLLEVRGLHAAYGPTRVLQGIDLDVSEGQVVALLGANGAGKTTTLRALCQMMVSTQGTITLAGQRIDGRATEQIAKAGVGHVPDGRGTFLGLTTEENLRLGAYARASRAGVEDDLAKVYGYFPRLKERHAQQAGTLSGGEQQMLAIGRALMGKPRLLLLDEPSFGLAPLIVKDIFSIMRRINQEERVSILLVEQNAKLALELASTAYLIETGRIVLSGPSADIRNNDAVRRAYLGD